jgi:2-hydroxy-3-keto-5-methylthiopentenyl-1-phosphate phosphatase
MSQEQVEAKLVEQTTSIVETIKKINEALKDTRISELCEKLYAYAKALDAIVNKKHYIFELQFELVGTAYAGMEYIVRLYVGNEQISSISIDTDATIKAMFEKIFTSQEMRSHIVNTIHKTLAEIAEEIAEKADLVERIKEIEERLEEEDP